MRKPKKGKPQTTALTPVVDLVPQPHGGALAAGGTPGNAGGLGATPSAIRELCRGSFKERVPILERIADGVLTQEIQTKLGPVLVTPSFKERANAIDILGKYAGLEKITVESVPSAPESLDAVKERALAMLGRLALVDHVAKQIRGEA